MKKGVVITVLGVFSAFVFGATLAMADAKKIDWPEAAFGKAKTKAVPTFNHEKHGADLGCKACHHKEELKAGDKAAKSCVAAECHGATADGKKLTAKDIIHKKPEGRCLQCHATDAKAMAAKAPTKCAECHPGKE